jgi:hypothetical protein
MGLSITCLDTLNYDKTVRALQTTLETLKDKVEKVYWFSDIRLPVKIDCPVVWVKIDTITRNNWPYDLNKNTLKLVPEVVTEDYNLMIQWDGFAVNPDAWTDEFLEYDYIGAVWSWNHDIYGTRNQVGNGGFSLRSKKLYQAILDFNLMKKPLESEDDMICRIYADELKEKYGIKFAPNDLADQFSIEHNTTSPWFGKSLGFHGIHGVSERYGFKL